MESIREYILSVTAAAIISGILSTLLGKKGSIGTIGTMLCGIFLSIAVVRPIADIRLDDWSDWAASVTANASASVAAGEIMASEAAAEIIKSRSEAYILDKAQSMDLALEVCVSIDGGDICIPTAVEIRGAVSPYEKDKLARIIAEDLGIAKENQRWIT